MKSSQSRVLFDITQNEKTKRHYTKRHTQNKTTTNAQRLEGQKNPDIFFPPKQTVLVFLLLVNLYLFFY